MDAKEYLRHIKRESELFEWFLRIVPPEAGGSDLQSFPPWLRDQLSEIGITEGSDPIELLRRFVDTFDPIQSYGETFANQLAARLPPRLAQKFCVGPRLAFGSTTTTDVNGRAIPIEPQGSGWVVVLSMGAGLLLRFAASLLALHLPDPIHEALRRATRKGSSRHDGGGVPAFDSIEHVRSHYPRETLAEELANMIRRHVEIGAVDPPQISRDYPFSVNMFEIEGHPLAAGHALSHFAVHFLILHECAHVALDHRSKVDESVQWEREYAADRWAMAVALDLAETTNVGHARALGAALFLIVVEWIEWMEEKVHPAQPQTHPPAHLRLARLQRFLGDELPEVLPWIVEVLGASDSYRRAASWIRDAEPGETALDRLIKQCVSSGRVDLFKDQLPRWLLFGAPQKLCRALAKARRWAENSQRECGSAPAELKLIMWVFAAVRGGSNLGLASLLQQEYDSTKEMDHALE